VVSDGTFPNYVDVYSPDKEFRQPHIYIYIDMDNIPYDILMLYRQKRTSNIGKFYGYDSMTLQEHIENPWYPMVSQQISTCQNTLVKLL